MRRSLWPSIPAAVLATVVLAGVADARTYRSPGFKGPRVAPQTLPAPPPTPIVLSERGAAPQVLVDDAGTGHITWKEDRGTSADVLRYCRLKRGATSCEASHDLVPQQPGDPQFNIDSQTPRVLVIGDQLVALTHRYPIVVPSPDGGTEDSNTYLFTSRDGGSSFDPPGLVGNSELSGQPAVFGPPDGQRIGLISDTQTGGAFFQAISAGRYERNRAVLGQDGIHSSLAPVGDSVIAAYTYLDQATTYVRQWTGQGDIHNPGTWTEASVPGGEPRLASGPGGVFLVVRGPGPSLDVRRVNGPTSFGEPVPVPASEGSSLGDFFQDPSGRLFLTYSRFGENGLELFMRSSTDGTTWTNEQQMYVAEPGAPIPPDDIGATSDGGGFDVLQQGGGSENRILALPFGNQGPTGRPGLGGLPGGEADPSIVETCQRVEFEEVAIRAQQGCLLGVAGKPGLRVSEGPLLLNGIEIIPDPGTKILMNARQREIQSFGDVTMQMRAPGVPPVVLFHGGIKIDLDAEQAAARTAQGTTTKRCTAQRLMSFNADTDLFGFPVKGKLEIFIKDQTSCVEMSLELPDAFGGIRGEAILRADNVVGLKVESLKIEVEEAHIGPLLIEDLLVRYSAAEDEWEGEVTLGIPPQPGGAKLGAGIKFERGAFKEGSLKLEFPFPGIALDPFAASYLSEVEGTFGIDPIAIGAGATIGILPLPPDKYTFSVEGEFTARFGDPVEFEFMGTGKVVDFPVVRERIVIDTNGFARVDASVLFDLADVVRVFGEMNAFVDLQSEQFGGKIQAEVCLFFCGEGEVVVSTRGMGVCTSVGGFGYHWGDSPFDVDVMLVDCDISEYEVMAPAGRAAQAGGRTFEVPAGATVASLRLAGDGGAPRVALISPAGERIVPVGPGGDPAASALYLSAGNRTFVGVRNPAAGTWRVEPEPGSPAITELAQARELPEPSVSGRVGGRARRRVLSYSATVGNGLRTTFVETGPAGSNVIGRARARRGRIRFSPAPGPRGRRTIEAIVERNGFPRLHTEIASYTAPRQARPGRARRVRVRQRGRTLTVRWRRARAARAYDVRFDLPDGRRLLRVLPGRARRVRMSGVPRRGRPRVAVNARDRYGRAGPVTRRRGR